MKYVVILLILLGLGGYLFFMKSSSGDKQQKVKQTSSSSQSTPQKQATKKEMSSEWAWLRKVKGKPIKAKDIANLPSQVQSKTRAYIFKGGQIRISDKDIQRKYRATRKIPFRLTGTLFSGKVGQSKLPPNYKGMTRIVLINIAKKKVAAVKSISLRKLCFS